MSADLDLNATTGTANMFFRLGQNGEGTPWHREGHPIPADRVLTLEEALELCELDFEVVKRASFTEFTTPDGDTYTRKNESAFTTWRTDRDVELGAVGPDYVPIQNALAFRAMQPLLESGVLVLETGGALRGGADVWMLGRFDIERFGPVVREVFADEVVPYALFTNNHNGRRNATVAETPIRVVCANTLGMAEHAMDNGGRCVKIRHTASGELKMAEAAESLFAGIVERYEIVAKQFKLLKADILARAEFERLVLDVVAPDPRKNPKFVPDARMAEAVVRRADAKRAELERLWLQGKGHSGDQSAWEAYNGVVEALDHDAKGLFPVRGGVYRTASLLEGKIRVLKTDLLNGLVRHAEKALALDA